MSSAAPPSSLRPYLKKAALWLKKGAVKDIEFSEATYQVLVVDPKEGEEAWAFLQFDESDGLRDAFCSCEQDDEEGEDREATGAPGGQHGCCHLAAAWLRLFRGGVEPLHRRFHKSLWHQLCRLYADKLGDDSSVLRPYGKEGYAAFSAGGKRICSITSSTEAGRERLHTLLFDRHQPTEETSIKFSNLSHEELLLWRTGQPSSDLRYELSFWSDLAKWMLWMQEEETPYTITFDSMDEMALPHRICITFKELAIDFYLSVANWPSIIPALIFVDAPLRVVDERQQGLASIVYHEDEAVLEIIPKAEQPRPYAAEKFAATIVVDGWHYLPKVGFFATAPHELLEHPRLTGSAIEELLTTQTSLVSELLQGATLHADSTIVSYKLEFDSSWHLHISCYVLEPGDLSERGAALFNTWAYLPRDGFYRVEGVHFPTSHLVIAPEAIPDFLTRQRSWLSQQAGFQTHISSLEEQLFYKVDSYGTLALHQQIQNPQSLACQHEFGSWLYIAGEGFYAKALSVSSRPIRAGVTIAAEQIPLFIKMHTEELHFVKNFFSSRCPVASVGLKVTWVAVGQSDSVRIVPDYRLFSEYRENSVHFFDEYVYVAGEGFSELPPSLRLPEEYRQPFTVVGEELERFFSYQLDEVRALAFHIDSRLLPPKQLSLTIQELSIEEKSPGWYRLHLLFTTEIGSVSAYEVWQALQRKKKFLCSGAGLLDLSGDLFTWLHPVRKQRFVTQESLLLSTLELIRLQALATIPIPEERQLPSLPSTREGRGAIPSVHQLLTALLDFTTTPPPTPVALTSVLRPYQQLGLHWLWSLYQRGLSGLLCDDMGLGKTHQAMALLDVILHSSGTDGEPCYALIICPTSVIYHWQEKLQAFLPAIPVYTFYGSGRRLALQDSVAIVLTSYGIARNESERLSAIPFNVAIFDEIQTAKNHRSRIYKALQTLQARMRVGMTGTPIENHLRELKSLFDLTLPTYLPGERDFRDYFIKPIEKEGDATKKALLSRLIKPFILRRRKEEVLTDLPPKIEEVVHCSLLPNQRLLYNAIIEQARPLLLNKLGEDNEPVPYLHIFSILSALKQICNHPAAYLKDPASYRDHPSGKWNLFLELLQEARHSGQKVLVFSHYLAMLEIMSLYLKDQGIGYSLLRGDTRDRAGEVQRFQEDPSCEVFLGSLQAAGTGIDLTAATVVIHYDRWWNAAKERQATDRAYRIGQSRGVQVFKLVTKETFEERIDAMIVMKGMLLEEVVKTDDHQLLKQLSRRELMELLREVEGGRAIATMPLNDEL